VKAATGRRSPNAIRALNMSVQSKNYAAFGGTPALHRKGGKSLDTLICPGRRSLVLPEIKPPQIPNPFCRARLPDFQYPPASD
jgi:hypothetical protein